MDKNSAIPKKTQEPQGLFLGVGFADVFLEAPLGLVDFGWEDTAIPSAKFL